MDISTIANVATAITVLTGVIFGLFEVRHLRREREERAAFELLHTMLTSAWLRSAVFIDTLPDNIAPEILEADPGMLDDMMGGIVRVTWRKMERYVMHDRARSGSQKGWEWFQWLYVQLERHSKSKTSLRLGAFDALRDWKP